MAKPMILFKDCAGKTIERVVGFPDYGDFSVVGVHFTDGTCAIIGASRNYDGERYVDIEREETEAGNLSALGVITDAERDMMLADERKAQDEADEREMYRRLKAKFEKPQ